MDDRADLTSLLAQAESGDEAAWLDIVDRFTNLLWSVCRSFRLHDDQALDVIQTTWLRLVENLGRIHDPERLAGWLAVTSRRECLRVLRLSGREDVGWTDTTVSGAIEDTAVVRVDIPESVVDLRLLTDERNAALWTCFSQLSERCQRLLRVLMATETQSYADVSAALGVPVGSIGPTRMRCLTRLRQLARDSGHESLVGPNGAGS
jgi:RNA polymerase sigma factor (sigma-70 family)